MDRRVASAFYYDIVANDAKGDQSASGTLIGAQSGFANNKGGRMYAMNMVQRETLAASGGASVAIKPGLVMLDQAFIEVKDGTTEEYTVIAKASSAGVFTATTAGTDAGYSISGTLAAAGTHNIVITGANSGDTYHISYVYQYDNTGRNSDTGNLLGVSGVNLKVWQTPVQAIDFNLRADYSLTASIDLQKAHGLFKLGPSYSDIRYKKAA